MLFLANQRGLNNTVNRKSEVMARVRYVPQLGSALGVLTYFVQRNCGRGAGCCPVLPRNLGGSSVVPRPGSSVPRPGSSVPRPGPSARFLGSSARFPRFLGPVPRPGSSVPRPGSSVSRPGSSVPRRFLGFGSSARFAWFLGSSARFLGLALLRFALALH